MQTTPRRNWFQVHLSTAIVLMFLAGGMMWINTIKQFPQTDKSFYVQGVPFLYYYHGGFQQSLDLELGPFEPIPLILDIWSALGVLFAVGFGLESRIRNRKLSDTLLGMLAVAMVCFVILFTMVFAFYRYQGHPAHYKY